MNQHPRAFLVLAIMLPLAACAGAGPTPLPPTPAGCQPVTLLTHDSFAVSDSVLEAFEEAHCVSVQVLRAGDAGAMVSQAILTRDNPVADVLYGIDNTFLSRAFDAAIFEPYHAPLVDSVRAELRLDARERVTPVDYGDVCLNYDRAAFSATPPPQALADLAKPQYRSQLVVENPATSSPGLAFMLATIVRFGETGGYTWLDYWQDLRDNDALVSSGWEDAYYGSFSGGSGEGDRPIVVSYATSPAAEVFYASPQPAEAPTDVVTDGCFRQVEFAAVLVGHSGAADAARRLLDFMLSAEFQADIPLNMFVFPAVPTTQLPQLFVDNAAQVAQPLTMAPEQIAANRERWLGEWSDVVLH